MRHEGVMKYLCVFTSLLRLLQNASCSESSAEYWDVNTQKGIMKGQSLRFRKIVHPTNIFHSCYEVKCDGKSCPTDNTTSVLQFCYPSVIITGLPKCGTSAMYDLLSKMPNVVLMHEKENCPSTRRRSHWQYFHSLPTMQSLTKDSITIDGCIDVVTNIKMRVILHNPDAFYIVSLMRLFNASW